ncbi:MAG: class I SAM-dependent methyltransferase [Desulfovibrio sp.]
MDSKAVDAIRGIMGDMQAVSAYTSAVENLSKVEGWQTPLEGFALLSFAAKGPGKGAIVEIGSFKGRATCYLGLGTKSTGREKVYAVDSFQEAGMSDSATYFDEFMTNVKKNGLSMQVRPVPKKSIEAAKEWDKPIRLLFIDGEHTYEGVKSDFTLWEKHVVEGGIIAFHDANSKDHPEVGKFVAELLEDNTKFKRAISIDSCQFILKV